MRLRTVVCAGVLALAAGCAIAPRDQAVVDCEDQAAAAKGYRISPDRQHVYSTTAAHDGHFLVDLNPELTNCLRAKGY
jgi:hypothetical protein